MGCDEGGNLKGLFERRVENLGRVKRLKV